jgi:selenocysteine lyase/cysteine desulfurase
MGFLYVSGRMLARLDPPARAFMTSRPASAGWAEYLEDPRRHPADMLRFPGDAAQLERAALGTTMAAAGLAGAAETLLAIGRSEVAERSAQLVQATREGLERVGAKTVTPPSDPPSSIVTFRSSPEIHAERMLLESLAREGILASLRFSTGVGGIRLSPYFYNDEADIERMLACVGAATGRRASGRP